ncbi:MAG: prepilin peptidase [Oscillospiraceae bacterium]|nr:prepilin peptidase [Oscillospiraceae bacterium]
MPAYEIAIIFILAATGASVASFANATALRRKLGKSNLKGRSECTHCKKTLVWFELIPIISFLCIKGKCRTCGKRLSARYFFTEITGAILAALCFIKFGFTILTPFSLFAVFILLAIALIDLSTMEIPNALIIALIPPAVLSIWLMPDVTILSRAIGFFAISLPMLILALIISGAFGGGDIKLMAVAGFILGWQSVLVAAFIAVFTGGLEATILLVSKKATKGAQIPFGPYLSLGCAAALLFGREIITYYLSFFLVI